MTVHDKNIIYYDSIAAEYDSQLSHDHKNLYIRDTVARKFTEEVKGHLVLDFGGGTGQDFGWLLNHGYQIVFCEPSRAMRQLARDRKLHEFPDSDIIFFEDEQADFRNWAGSFPFEQKVDAVLANFAVLNCIQDLGVLFDKLSMALKLGGQVFALVLDENLMKLLRSKPGDTIKSFISGKPIRLSLHHNNHAQEVYVHTVRSIRKACRGKFNLIRQIRLDGYGFRLIHLMKK